ncbi:MAG: histidine--tRNA ligase [Nanoarchaeota archaeon]|nr:histidine--tRNA ligase [Nanoarchaeota archaeon]
MKIQRAKGTKDFPPEEKIKRQYIVDTLRKVFEIYGFQPLETPILERYETLSAKFAAGEGSDALKETFRLKDQGGRQLGLRFDLTVPMSRFIAMNPQLKMPFKRYQIGRCFRDGPVEKERIREFWQCDVDTVGVKSMKADAEILNLVKDAFKALKLKIKIKLNNRKILNSILDYLKIKNKDSVMITIDKLYKISVSGVKKELKEKKLDDKTITKLMKIINIKGSNQEKFKKLEFLKDKEGLNELKELNEYFNDFEFDVSLARGLSYYTGTVFEVVLEDKSLGCSVAGGGRYDNMIGGFIGKGEYPAVGIAFGLEPISSVIKFKELKSLTKVFVIPINTFKESLKIVQELRRNGINSDIDLLGRGISKNLDYANKLGIPYVVFLGEDELKKGKYKLKDMKTGKEEFLDLDGLVKRLG